MIAIGLIRKKGSMSVGERKNHTLVRIYIIYYNKSALVKVTTYKTAAAVAPRIGARMYTAALLNVVVTTAGARYLQGLNEAPVKGKASIVRVVTAAIMMKHPLAALVLTRGEV
jgi:hypothetical protein